MEEEGKQLSYKTGGREGYRESLNPYLSRTLVNRRTVLEDGNDFRAYLWEHLRSFDPLTLDNVLELLVPTLWCLIEDLLIDMQNFSINQSIIQGRVIPLTKNQSGLIDIDYGVPPP